MLVPTGRLFITPEVVRAKNTRDTVAKSTPSGLNIASASLRSTSLL